MVNAICVSVIDTEAFGLILHTFISLTGLGPMGTMEPFVFAPSERNSSHQCPL